MKRIASTTRIKPVVPSLFQIAEHPDNAVPAAGLKRTAPAPSQTPFTDLVLHPDKLVAALKAAEAEKEALEASRTIRRNNFQRMNRKTPNNDVTVQKNSAGIPRQPRKVEFSLRAPSARSVKLAADFTNWEKCPRDLTQNEDGVWFSFIPLEPGQYAYRFIVDGQWCDDPRSTQRVPNPFGTENALLVVT